MSDRNRRRTRSESENPGRADVYDQDGNEVIPEFFRSGGMTDFAIDVLGEEAKDMEPAERFQKLVRTAWRENWSPFRDEQMDECHLCGWRGQHATPGRMWHITKDNQFYLHHEPRGTKRPNFLFSAKYKNWVCLRCVRQAFATHTKSYSEAEDAPMA